MQKLQKSITKKLNKLGKFDIERTADSIKVSKNGSNGFPVTLYRESRGFMVYYGHYWHRYYETEEEAEDWFMSGVTGWARLVCSYNWRYLVKSTVELKDEDRWTRADTNGSCLAFLVWWLPRQTVILMNTPDIADRKQG